jgi:hypothetical protein
MATNTYVALDKATVSGSSTTTVTFTVPSGYTDLFIVTSARNSTSGGTDYYMRFNSDTASNYSYTQMIGNGSSAASDRASSASQFNIGYVAGTSGTAPTICRINIQNYSNATTNKAILYNWNSEGADAKYVLQGVGLWRKTPEAITSVSIYTTSGNIVAGSTFSLYGISNAGDATPKATGGDVFEDATYWYHAFTMSGNFVPNQTLSCDVLVVGGGGGGGGQSGGGGAGGYRTSTGLSFTATNYPITIGAGGAGGVNGGTGTSGTASICSTITSSGGGRGATDAVGIAGGSGGGGGALNNAGGAGNSGGYSPVEGYAGGQGFYNSGTVSYATGGGGGASAVGSNAVTSSGGAAGAGGAGSNSVSSWATVTGTGVSGYYAGGGGGSGNSGSGYTATAAGAGGTGGGGAGTNTNTAAGSGTISTGSGGGGGGYNGTAGAYGTAGSGGSGIVIVRYAK